MLTVAGDRDLVERQLAGGLLACPECGTGVLGGHGWVPSRWLRRADGRVVLLKARATGQEKASGKVADGLRRGRCKAPGCGVTHVLAPPQVLFRRLDETRVIGEVLAARAGGRGGYDGLRWPHLDGLNRPHHDLPDASVALIWPRF